MLCAVEGSGPPSGEAEAWEKLVLDLAKNAHSSAAEGKSGLIRKVQLYGKVRPAPEDPKATALPVKYLEERAFSLRRALSEAKIALSVEIYP
jgi:histidinol dehydrogenase